MSYDRIFLEQWLQTSVAMMHLIQQQCSDILHRTVFMDRRILINSC